MSPAIRRRAITALRLQGVGVTLIAETAGISRTRVGQLVAAVERDFWKDMARENREWEARRRGETRERQSGESPVRDSGPTEGEAR
jgi:hypothetical protein